MVYSYIKQPYNTQAHLSEYRDWQASLPRYLKPDEAPDFLRGFLQSIGFHDRLTSVWDYKLGVVFLPWLDEYWTRPGRIWINMRDIYEMRMMTFRLRIASCMREARNRDELYRLIDYSRAPNNKDWFWLGGSE